MMKYRKAGFCYLMSSVIILFILSSCKKGSDAVYETGQAHLTLNASIKENGNIQLKRSNSTFSKNHAKLSLNTIARRTLQSDFEVQVSSEDFYGFSRDSGLKAGTTPSKGVMKNERTEKLKSGVSYILKIFRDNQGIRGNQIGEDHILSSGEEHPKQIKLDGGQRYHWIAISNNENNPPTVNNNEISQKDALNKDILYASGSFTAVQGKNLLNIQFEHKTSRIEISIDSRGMSMPFSEGSNGKISMGSGKDASFLGMIKSKTFNILTGEFIGEAAFVPDIPFVLTDSERTISKSVIFHSAEPVTLVENQMSIRVGDISFWAWFLNNKISFTESKYLAAKNSAVVVNPGEKYAIALDFIQSPAEINGIKWSRESLAFHPDTPYGMPQLRFMGVFGHQAFHHINPNVNYFRWNALQPLDATNTGSYDSTKDPCLQVYPKGIWRMPTADEAESLVTLSAENIQVSWQDNAVLRHNVGIRIAHVPSGPAAKEYIFPQRYMAIFFQGYRSHPYDENEPIPYLNSIRDYYSEVYKEGRQIYSNPVSAMFWTSDAGSTPGTAKAYVRQATYTRINEKEIRVDFGEATIQDVDRNLGLQIRCIRTK